MHSEKWELNLSQESSQKLENFRDSRTRFFPDCAGKNSPVQTLVLSVPPW